MDGGAGRRQVAAGGTSGTVSVRVVDGATVSGPCRDAGRAATVTPLPLSPSNDESYVRGPLTATGDLVTATAYHPDGAGFTYPPSAIVRFDGATGRVADRVDLQGEVEALSDGEGTLAQTRDKTVTGPQDPEFRVKRITADDNHVSNPIPPPNHPAGPLVAAGGAVWVPVTDGVLRFDAVTGAYAGKVALPTTTDRRGVALLGKGSAYVTDGTTLRRLDPGSDANPDPEVDVPRSGGRPAPRRRSGWVRRGRVAHHACTGGFVLVEVRGVARCDGPRVDDRDRRPARRRRRDPAAYRQRRHVGRRDARRARPSPSCSAPTRPGSSGPSCSSTPATSRSRSPHAPPPSSPAPAPSPASPGSAALTRARNSPDRRVISRHVTGIRPQPAEVRSAQRRRSRSNAARPPCTE